jgi:hypothetical protein
MNRIQVGPGQLRFDPLDFEDQGVSREEARKQALAARTMVVNRIKKDWPDKYNVCCWTLSGQLRKYKAFGVPDGRSRSVYYVNITELQQS